MEAATAIGVIGAGTMGAGIAQLAAQAGRPTLLHDAVPDAIDRGLERIAAALERQVEKGRMSEDDARAVRGRLEPAPELEDLAPCGVVIEAAPERLDLKLDVLGRLAEIVAEDTVIATNTSSLSVTEIAGGVRRPERVVGLHFFNPAPVMRLVEVVAGETSSPAAVAAARALGEAMGKRVIDAADIAGFLVNRCNRPFSLEALKLLEERVASVEQIDRIARMGGHFRMGPFELMDLIGIETNHAVAEGFHRATYGEPRYRPSPLAARMVAAGRLGRKTGRGWYEYPNGAASPADDPEPPAPGGGDGRVVAITGAGPLADGLRELAARAGWVADGGEPWLVVDTTPPGDRPTRAAPVARLVRDGSLHRLEPTAAGFHLLPPLDSTRLVELTTTAVTDGAAIERTEAFFRSLGLVIEHVGDAPGLVLGRIVSQLVNEAAFLIGEENGTADDVDAGLELGVNHPRGPVAWSDEMGPAHAVAILDALHAELGEPRYRVAPLLRRATTTGIGLRGA